jgi:hypothetical protein
VRRIVASVLPIAAALVGQGLSILCFRADHAFGGLAWALGGMIALILLAMRVPPTGG